MTRSAWRAVAREQRRRAREARAPHPFHSPHAACADGRLRGWTARGFERAATFPPFALSIFGAIVRARGSAAEARRWRNNLAGPRGSLP